MADDQLVGFGIYGGELEVFRPVVIKDHASRMFSIERGLKLQNSVQFKAAPQSQIHQADSSVTDRCGSHILFTVRC